MKKFTVYANCQSTALAKTLIENKEFSSIYEWIPIPPVHHLKKDNAAEILEKIKGVDLFIHQPISKLNRPLELSSDFLATKIKYGSDVVSFPSLFFDGYFPHLQTFKGYISELNLVHDYFIAYCCSVGLDEYSTINLMQSENLYTKDLSVTLCEKSLNNLRNREQQFSTDIRISDFIENNYQRVKLFNQFNHPKRLVFKRLAESVMEMIGIKQFSIEEQGPCFLDKIITPIYRSTYKNLELEFQEDFNTYNGLKQKGINQKDVVSGFFKFYKTQNLEEIRLHVSKNKPFIPIILNDLTKRCKGQAGSSVSQHSSLIGKLRVIRNWLR